MRRNFVVCALRNDNQRATTLRIARCKLEEDHGCVTMRHHINCLQPQTIQHLAQFLSSLNQANRVGTCLTPSIQNNPSCLTEGTDLPGIDKFKVFENRYKNQWLTLAYVYHRHVCRANCLPLPERLNILHISMKGVIIDVKPGMCAHYISPTLCIAPNHC